MLCGAAGVPGVACALSGRAAVCARGRRPSQLMVLLVAPRVFRAPYVLSCGPGCSVCPWAAARPRAVRAASFARRVASKPGQAPPPPTGTAAWPSGPSGALHTGGAWCVDVWFGASARSPARPRRHPPAPRPGPATAHRCRNLAPTGTPSLAPIPSPPPLLNHIQFRT